MIVYSITTNIFFCNLFIWFSTSQIEQSNKIFCYNIKSIAMNIAKQTFYIIWLMKTTNISAIAIIISLLFFSNLNAQELNKKIDWFFVGGLNFGATAPLPFPSSRLDIKGVTLKINPQLGANVIYNINERWGVGTGLTIDWKSMSVRTKVHDVYSHITTPTAIEGIPAGAVLYGHIQGRATTNTNMIYLTQPFYATYRFSPKWQIRFGGYIAETLKREFKGSVKDVSIIIDKINDNPVNGLEKDIPYATYNFSKNVRKFEAGLLTGGEYRLNNTVGFYANFSWALHPYFSGKNPVDFTTRNLFGNLGVTYRLKNK